MDFNASKLQASNLEPQWSNLGSIEFHINKLVPNGKEPLVLGLKSVSAPNARTINKETAHHLQGGVHFPGKPSIYENISLTVYDYINGRQREVLQKWFDLAYNARTGRGLLASQLKINAHYLLFARDGSVRAKYLLVGIFPLNEPKIPDFDYANASMVTIPINISIDDAIPLGLDNSERQKNTGLDGAGFYNNKIFDIKSSY